MANSTTGCVCVGGGVKDKLSPRLLFLEHLCRCIHDLVINYWHELQKKKKKIGSIKFAISLHITLFLIVVTLPSCSLP